MIIVIDTREQQPATFMGHEVIRQKLDEGDYCTAALLEYEQKTGNKTVRIERKKSTAELANNLGKGFDRFEKELQRLFPYERKVLLCEFTYDHILRFPEDSGIPKNKWFRRGKNGRLVKNIYITPKMMLDKLEYIQNIYDIEIIYTEDKFEASRKIEEILDVFEKKIQG